MKRSLCAAFLIVLVAFFAPIPAASQSEPSIHRPAGQTRHPPIKSLPELKEYLHKTPKGQSVFDGFSPAGMQRFIAD